MFSTGRSDQSEALSRPHGLYSTESLQSIFPDAKLMDLFASVDKDPEVKNNLQDVVYLNKVENRNVEFRFACDYVIAIVLFFVACLLRIDLNCFVIPAYF